MRKRIISESFENRMHELSGIIQENAHKIMGQGFIDKIAKYLSDLDKKRGLFLADSLTRQYVKDKGLSDLEGLNIKQMLESINQEDLFNYMRSRESDVLMILDWIKQGSGQVNLRDFGSFEEILSAASQKNNSDEDVFINFSPDVENYLKEIDYDLSDDLGILALKDFVSHEHPEINIEANSLENIVEMIDQKEFLNFLKKNENELFVIVDWINSPLRQDGDGALGNIEKSIFFRDKGFKNLGEALFAANDWHTHLAASGKLMNPTKGKIIERYSDGYYWIDLETNDSKDEAQAMGHCGVDKRATTLLSLRDEKGEPHVTIAYNENTKNVGQVKGKNNKRPVDKYMVYVNDLLKKMVKSDKLESFVWSYPVYGPDLNQEELDDILSNLSAKAKFRIAKKGIVRRAGVGNLGVRH